MALWPADDIECAWRMTNCISNPPRFLMAQDHRDVTLAEVKLLLEQFAASRASKPREDVESDYGDLLLYLIHLAGKSGVDLVAGANVELDRKARDLPRPAALRL
jgi:NTP pyrophosphatase (non-canonical NTP hydrolase)